MNSKTPSGFSRINMLQRARYLLIYVLTLLGALMLLVTFTPLVEWAARALAGPWRDPKGDVLIVLGGADLQDGIIGRDSYLRSVYALRAFREGTFKTVVLSGGGIEQKTVAASMRDFIECQGIPAGAIVEENNSMSTRENALYSRQLLNSLPGQKVLMTSDYHMFRAQRVFKKLGIQTLPRPIPDVIKRGATWRGRWPAFIDLIVEALKITYYFARGWI